MRCLFVMRCDLVTGLEKRLQVGEAPAGWHCHADARGVCHWVLVTQCFGRGALVVPGPFVQLGLVEICSLSAVVP